MDTRSSRTRREIPAVGQRFYTTVGGGHKRPAQSREHLRRVTRREEQGRCSAIVRGADDVDLIVESLGEQAAEDVGALELSGGGRLKCQQDHIAVAPSACPLERERSSRTIRHRE